MCALVMVSASPRPLLWHIPWTMPAADPKAERQADPQALREALEQEAGVQNGAGMFWESSIRQLREAGVYFGGEWDLSESSDEPASASERRTSNPQAARIIGKSVWTSDDDE